MKEKMIRTQVYLPRDIYIKLKKRANEEDISMAHQIREALTQHVVESEAYTESSSKYSIPSHDPLWDMIGMGKNGPEDGSRHYNKYIYMSDWDPQENEA
jgi:hypothetical protein